MSVIGNGFGYVPRFLPVCFVILSDRSCLLLVVCSLDSSELPYSTPPMSGSTGNLGSWVGTGALLFNIEWGCTASRRSDVLLVAPVGFVLELALIWISYYCALPNCRELITLITNISKWNDEVKILSLLKLDMDRIVYLYLVPYFPPWCLHQTKRRQLVCKAGPPTCLTWYFRSR